MREPLTEDQQAIVALAYGVFPKTIHASDEDMAAMCDELVDRGNLEGVWDTVAERRVGYVASAEFREAMQSTSKLN